MHTEILSINLSHLWRGLSPPSDDSNHSWTRKVLRIHSLFPAVVSQGAFHKWSLTFESVWMLEFLIKDAPSDDSVRLQPSSNTGRAQALQEAVWPQVGEDIQQSDSSEGTQAQTFSYHKADTIESLPNSGRLAGPVSTPTSRECRGEEKNTLGAPHE